MAMFRQKALAKQRSPEQLDEPLKVIQSKTNLALWTALILCVLALLWGIFGHLPVSGRGQGILVTPNTVVPVQAKADGKLAVRYVNVGDVVEKGKLLGLLEMPEVERELAQTKAKMAEIERRNRDLGEKRNEYTKLERDVLLRKGKIYNERMRYLQDYVKRAEDFAVKVDSYSKNGLDLQRNNLISQRSAAVELSKQLKDRQASYTRLRNENLASVDTLRDVSRRFDDSQLKLRDLDLQIQQFDLKRVELQDSYLQTRNTITTREHTLTQLNLQYRELENRGAQLSRQDQETENRDRNELLELARRLERLEKRLQTDREIRSDFSGRILEWTAMEGSVVTLGQRLIQISIRQEKDDLVALAYFQADVGKHLHAGVIVRVSPSTVDQKLYGSVRGQVVSVSQFPVTSDAVVNYVGNQSVAEKLTQGNYEIEVMVRLEKDSQTPSGYAWTSLQGPDVQITAGTSADVWVTYERRSPITYIMPKLRQWTGLTLAM